MKPITTLMTTTFESDGSANMGATQTPFCFVLGLKFHTCTKQQAVDVLERFVAEKTPRHIVLANAYTLASCKNDPVLTDMMNRADLILPDGMSIVWGARWLGITITERVAGPDLMELLCSRAQEKDQRIFLMGSSSENLQNLSSELQRRWPTLKIAGTYSPSVCERFDEPETQLILDRIHGAKPDILFVGLSAPKQEKWISENLRRLNVPVAIGVGAAFDFLSGRIPRAPIWMQRLGLEWLYRLYREPQRLWRRYLLGNAVFLSLLAKERLRYQWRKLTGSSRPSGLRPFH